MLVTVFSIMCRDISIPCKDVVLELSHGSALTNGRLQHVPGAAMLVHTDFYRSYFWLHLHIALLMANHLQAKHYGCTVSFFTHSNIASNRSQQEEASAFTQSNIRKDC